MHRGEALSSIHAVGGLVSLTSTTVDSCLRRTQAASKSFTEVSAGRTSFTASTPCHDASTSLFPK